MAVTFDELRQRLKNERERLSKRMEQVRATAPPAGEAKEGSPHGKMAEAAAEAFELEKKLALEKRLTGLLGEVGHALQKFEQGTYGLCDVCSQAIDRARLEILPQASLCVTCKERQAKDAKSKFVSS